MDSRTAGAVAENPPVIRMEGVRKVYLTDEVETHALADVHLEVAHGEFVSIAGPSGCGKSTLLAVMGLLASPTAGRYLINGHPADRLSVAERAKLRNQVIGFIFQNFNLIGDLTVLENVELPLVYGGTPSARRTALAREALQKVGMEHRLRHHPTQLSGGQQQRVAVARALVNHPVVLLADEPTGNLDSHNADGVMELLGTLHSEGATICMVTHDPRYARHAERTVHLFDGKVVDESHRPDAQDVYQPAFSDDGDREAH